MKNVAGDTATGSNSWNMGHRWEARVFEFYKNVPGTRSIQHTGSEGRQDFQRNGNMYEVKSNSGVSGGGQKYSTHFVEKIHKNGDKTGWWKHHTDFYIAINESESKMFVYDAQQLKDYIMYEGALATGPDDGDGRQAKGCKVEWRCRSAGYLLAIAL
jgi:hypothetical protein